MSAVPGLVTDPKIDRITPDGARHNVSPRAVMCSCETTRTPASADGDTETPPLPLLSLRRLVHTIQVQSPCLEPRCARTRSPHERLRPNF